MKQIYPADSRQHFGCKTLAIHEATQYASEFSRWLEHNYDELDAEEAMHRVWLLFGKAYDAGRYNPVPIVPKKTRSRSKKVVQIEKYKAINPTNPA